MRINIHGGTRQDRHICVDCARCTYMKGPVESQDRTFCGVMERFSTRVTDCSSFADKTGPEHNFRMFGGAAWSTAKDDDGLIWLVPPDLDGHYTRVREYLKERGAKVKSPRTGITSADDD